MDIKDYNTWNKHLSFEYYIFICPHEIVKRLKRTEEAARDNKTALSQLISHTKNVERAVTMSQQDILTKKETQVQK